jgi:hypothetical protein
MEGGPETSVSGVVVEKIAFSPLLVFPSNSVSGPTSHIVGRWACMLEAHAEYEAIRASTARNNG